MDKRFKLLEVRVCRGFMESPQTEQVYSSSLHILSQDRDGHIERLLQDIVEWEKSHPPQSQYDGFEWFDVHADPRTLNRLVTNRILCVKLKTNKSITYRMKDVNGTLKALCDYKGTFISIEESKEIPQDLFSLVVGHDEKKDLVKRSLKSENPVHFLLWGTVASAKTLLLEDLARLPQSHLVLGSALTRSGLFEVLYNERPRYLIIDELDKIGDVENLAALLSLMERGFIRETKYRRHRSLKLKTWVFASANEINHFSRELLSRFLLLRFRDYTLDEFINVAVTVLTNREKLPESLSLYIADKTANILGSRDVRDAVKVSRLLEDRTKMDVDHILSIMKGQK